MAGDIAAAYRGHQAPALAAGHGALATFHARGAKAAQGTQGKQGKQGKTASPSANPSPRPSPTPSPSPSASKPTAATLTCSGSGGLLPENYPAIVGFLMAHGYTGLAAAGIAGNIYQESKGNPESVGTGGGGLIGWTPLPAGFVTGNPAADLRTQLVALLTYNQQWAQYLPALNAATSAIQAADIFMTDFERPGIPAASNREGAAAAVAAACHL
jgi:hypothetical protein